MVGPRGSVLSLFDPFIVANLLRRSFQVEADLTSNSSGWNLELGRPIFARLLFVTFEFPCPVVLLQFPCLELSRQGVDHKVNNQRIKGVCLNLTTKKWWKNGFFLSHPVTEQMVKADVQDDLPEFDPATLASSSTGKYAGHKSGFTCDASLLRCVLSVGVRVSSSTPCSHSYARVFSHVAFGSSKLGYSQW